MYEYLKDMETIQSSVLDFLDEENGSNESFVEFKKKLTHKYRKYMEPIFFLLVNISTNHHRKPGFYQKIEKILLIFKDDINKLALIDEEILFRIFCNDKRLILFLIKEKILPINLPICKLLSDYYEITYFSPEFKQMIDEFPNDYAEKVQKQIYQETPENFEEFRYYGENENYICKLIQKDLIDEFIIYINKTNISINSSIKTSLFDTNHYLKEKSVSLIEYAAFYGSIQIFNYLRLNGAELNRSLFEFAIHGANSEIFLCIEENVKTDDKRLFKMCYKEAIKCHHNDFAHYIRNQYLYDIDINELANGIKYSNYIMYPDLNEDYHFFNMYQYDKKLAELYIKDKETYKCFNFNDNEFNFGESICEGYFGTSRIAEHKNTHKKYVNKIMDTEFTQLKDIDKLMKLKYPSLLNPIGYSELNIKSKLTVISVYFEYFPNGSLETYTNMKSLNSTQKYIIILGLAITFNYLHKNSIFHLSMHRRNILLDENLYPVLSDFTISFQTLLHNHRKYCKELILHKEKALKCNPYQPQEVVQMLSFNNNSDIYSFAMIMYHIISEKQPFVGEPMKIFTSISMGKHPNIDDFDEYTQSILNSCWSWWPLNRSTFDQAIKKITDNRFIDNFKNVDYELVKKYLDIFGDEYEDLKNIFIHK